MKYNFVVFFLMIILSSCGHREEGNIASTEITKTELEMLFCENEINLLSAPDTLPSINIDFSQNHDSIRNYLNSKLSMDSNRSIVYYSVPFSPITNKVENGDNSIHLTFKMVKKRADVMCMIRRNWFRILMNSKAQVLFKSRICKLDSMDRYISKIIRLNPDPVNPINFELYWDINTPPDSLTNLISNILTGVLDAGNHFSKRKFNKELCELPMDEYQIVKDSLRFSFELINILELAPPKPIY